MTPPSIASRLAALDWPSLRSELDARGFAATGPLLTAAECEDLIATYPDTDRFRSRIVMRRHGFGEGEYQYFARPLPALVADCRTAAYPHLLPLANEWRRRLKLGPAFPDDLGGFLAQCHAADQTRPTPLLLKYGPGDYNRLHQDLYGEMNFPLQLAVLLSAPGADFDGGEFVLTEQQPRSQSRAQVVPLARGEAVVFAVNIRPKVGTRGDFRVVMRHGVSQVRRGQRYCLGVIFHDAR